MGCLPMHKRAVAPIKHRLVPRALDLAVADRAYFKGAAGVAANGADCMDCVIFATVDHHRLFVNFYALRRTRGMVAVPSTSVHCFGPSGSGLWFMPTRLR
jgi:hypothetical protein